MFYITVLSFYKDKSIVIHTINPKEFNGDNKMKLKSIKQKIKIQATPEQVWSIISQFGNVANFHAGVKDSYKQKGSDNKATLGCERVCKIVDMGLNITLKERVTNIVEGKSYQFEVYECSNFPISKMLFGFEILNNNADSTELEIHIQYRAKPAFLTSLMAGKMRKLARDVSLGYKHHIETGEVRAPIKSLRKKYQYSDHLYLQNA